MMGLQTGACVARVLVRRWMVMTRPDGEGLLEHWRAGSINREREDGERQGSVMALEDLSERRAP